MGIVSNSIDSNKTVNKDSLLKAKPRLQTIQEEEELKLKYNELRTRLIDLIGTLERKS